MKSKNIKNIHHAKKRFGQNFLTDESYLNIIIKQINACAIDDLIEIGPGLGAMTKHLINQAASITAIEIDKDCIKYLNNNYQNQNLKIIEQDVLKIDFLDLIKNQKTRIIGNLPYNISTPLIIKLLRISDNIKDMTFLLQKEVVDRLAAKPNNRQYGRLSIIAQYYCEIEALTEVPPHAFSPAPKVQSQLVRLTPRKTIHNKINDIKLLEKITQVAFNQRRKQLKSAVKSLFTEDELISLNINPKLRPENLEISDYIKLAQNIDSKKY